MSGILFETQCIIELTLEVDSKRITPRTADSKSL